jgi:hypothetical protein
MRFDEFLSTVLPSEGLTSGIRATSSSTPDALYSLELSHRRVVRCHIAFLWARSAVRQLHCSRPAGGRVAALISLFRSLSKLRLVLSTFPGVYMGVSHINKSLCLASCSLDRFSAYHCTLSIHTIRTTLFHSVSRQAWFSFPS